MLVVEDDVTIATSIAARLRAEGFSVDVAHDGPAAVAADAEGEPELVVLDVMLPGFDGLEVCRRIQARRPVPVLMLTARADETDMLVGLGVGADDYLTKPFSMRVLAARVHALLRRVDRSRTDASGTRARRPRSVQPRERLLSEVWDWDVHGTSAGTRAVDSHIKALRRKLGADLIRTVHGVGYALEAGS